ncbi:MAG: hypothetical protein KME16_09240 [Scytolyngbya sp. HA4215-MV1]|nr:hypothetical protein [Scytolyngbya sp. HA4215-MV1]
MVTKQTIGMTLILPGSHLFHALPAKIQRHHYWHLRQLRPASAIYQNLPDGFWQSVDERGGTKAFHDVVRLGGCFS